MLANSTQREWWIESFELCYCLAFRSSKAIDPLPMSMCHPEQKGWRPQLEVWTDNIKLHTSGDSSAKQFFQYTTIHDCFKNQRCAMTGWTLGILGDDDMSE